MRVSSGGEAAPLPWPTAWELPAEDEEDNEEDKEKSADRSTDPDHNCQRKAAQSCRAKTRSLTQFRINKEMYRAGTDTNATKTN